MNRQKVQCVTKNVSSLKDRFSLGFLDRNGKNVKKRFPEINSKQKETTIIHGEHTKQFAEVTN